MDRQRHRGRSHLPGARSWVPAARWARAAGIVLILVLVALTVRLVAVRGFWAYSGLSDHYRLTQGQSRRLELRIPARLLSSRFASATPPGVLAVSWAESERRTPLVSLEGIAPGSVNLTVKALGGLLSRNVRVDVLPEVRVIPGGQAIGVMLAPSGVVVVGLAPVKGSDGRVHYPARDAGLSVGDCIERVGGIEVGDAHHVEHLIELAARRSGTVTLDVRRDGSLVRRRIVPVKTGQGPDRGGGEEPGESRAGTRFKVGLFVRDNSAGVGTLSFVLAGSNVYGALGHVVPDLVQPRQLKGPGPDATPEPAEGGPGEEGTLGDGRIVRAYIAGIEQGARGKPGEKIGMFEGLTDILGSIQSNTPCGIFGKLSSPLPRELSAVEPVPVGLVEETRLGPAQMLTVVNDTEVERFGVEIVRVTRQTRPGQRGLVVKVTDLRLARATGGIVQGMSGSPILQGGKLVGVVTHVLVSDPLRGYATHAEWMVREALRLEGGL